MRFSTQHDGALLLPRPWIREPAQGPPPGQPAVAEAPRTAKRPLPVVGETEVPRNLPIGSGRPPLPNLLEALRIKNRLTGEDVRRPCACSRFPRLNSLTS